MSDVTNDEIMGHTSGREETDESVPIGVDIDTDERLPGSPIAIDGNECTVLETYPDNTNGPPYTQRNKSPVNMERDDFFLFNRPPTQIPDILCQPQFTDDDDDRMSLDEGMHAISPLFVL